MKLHHSPTSPFVRKVTACAIARGLDGRIDTQPANAWTSPEALTRDNPLSKVPCLVADDGTALFDSPVICEYLDTLGDAPPLFPPPGPARWRALRQQAAADGIMDAAVLRRMEGNRPHDEARAGVMARQRAAIERALDMLEAEPPAEPLDIGGIAAACALGFLTFRFAGEPWHLSRPALAAWYARVATQPCLARTEPRDPA